MMILQYPREIMKWGNTNVLLVALSSVHCLRVMEAPPHPSVSAVPASVSPPVSSFHRHRPRVVGSWIRRRRRRASCRSSPRRSPAESPRRRRRPGSCAPLPRARYCHLEVQVPLRVDEGWRRRRVSILDKYWCISASNHGNPLDQGEHVTTPYRINSGSWFDFIECFTTTFLRAHSWLNWVEDKYWCISASNPLDQGTRYYPIQDKYWCISTRNHGNPLDQGEHVTTGISHK